MVKKRKTPKQAALEVVAREQDANLIEAVYTNPLSPIHNTYCPLYLHKLQFDLKDDSQISIGLIAGVELKTTQMHPIYNAKVVAFRIVGSRKLDWSIQEHNYLLNECDVFTRLAVMVMVHREHIKMPFYHCMVPLLENAETFDIDWDLLRLPFSPLRIAEEVSVGDTVIVPFALRVSRIFTVIAHRTDLNLESPMEPFQVLKKPDARRIKNYDDFFKLVISFFLAGHSVEKLTSSQFVLETRLCHRHKRRLALPVQGNSNHAGFRV